LLVSAACKLQKNANDQPIDLIKQIPYAEKSDNFQIIIFGTPVGKRSVVSGWLPADKNSGETFQWVGSEKSALTFKWNRIEPLYLHIKTRSFFENSAQVLLNGKTVGTIQVQTEPEVNTVELPAEMVNSEGNTIEFIWNELRQPPRPKNAPKVAAGAYFAMITPAKYLAGDPLTDLEKANSQSAMMSVAGKNRASASLNLGGTLRFYERLNKNSRLQFGILYDSPTISESDDFSDFNITLQKDGQKEQTIFQEKATDDYTSRESIALSKYINASEPEVYKIEFHINRNSILDSGKTAWIEPVLYQGFTSRNDTPEESISKLRRENERANVIIIIMDAAGAKHLQSYGYQRKTTPNVEKIAHDGIQFDKAYCQAVYTLASTATLMSGLDPYTHRIVDNRLKLPEKIVTLAERFSNSGYTTGSFIANGNASATYGMTQGFHEVREVYNEPNYTGWASDITKRFTQWLRKMEPERPFFAYVHYREPHGPFNPPESFKNYFRDPNYTRFKDASDEMRRKLRSGEIAETQADRDFITASYDENLRYGDYEVGRVMDELKRLKMYDRTIIIITADHGEAFWEHDFQGHNSQLYEESTHIPLILKLTAASNLRGKRVGTPVGTVDVYPALVDLLQLSKKSWDVDGRSFVPYLVTKKSENLPVLSQTINEQAFSYTEGNFKYIYHKENGAEELYDLKADPKEQQNIINTMEIQRGYLRTRLFGWQAMNKKSVRR
jgi:arylsulfatase A-like enzyme